MKKTGRSILLFFTEFFLLKNTRFFFQTFKTCDMFILPSLVLIEIFLRLATVRTKCFFATRGVNEGVTASTM